MERTDVSHCIHLEAELLRIRERAAMIYSSGGDFGGEEQRDALKHIYLIATNCLPSSMLRTIAEIAEDQEVR